MAEPEQTLIRTDKLGRAPCGHCGVVLDVSEFHVFEEIECPDCGKTTSVPGKLGGFTLLQELGRGGMGAVFLARDGNLDRKVALKVLNARYGRNPNFVDALLQEAKAAAALNHNHIVHIFSFGQIYEQPYFVMELVEGLRLDECIQPGRKQEEAGWLGVLSQLTLGLMEAEKVGLTHGDIKPANILFNERGDAKLSDFGIARFSGEEDDRILGTPLYIAPEKSRGKPCDARTDQFSLGATFWHILTGVPPYEGRTSRDVVLRRFAVDPPDPREHAPHLSAGTAELLMRMMAVEPADRYPNFGVVHARVEELFARCGGGESAERRDRDSPWREGSSEEVEEEGREGQLLQAARPAPATRRWWGLWIAVGIICVLAVLGYVVGTR